LQLGEAKKKEPTKGMKGFVLEKIGPSSHNMRKLKKTLINLDTYKGHISVKNMDQICAGF
jgi:hypothetical protein